MQTVTWHQAAGIRSSAVRLLDFPPQGGRGPPGKERAVAPKKSSSSSIWRNRPCCCWAEAQRLEGWSVRKLLVAVGSTVDEQMRLTAEESQEALTAVLPGFYKYL